MNSPTPIRFAPPHKFLLSVMNIAFIFLLLMLGSHNRFTSDDHGMIYLLNSFGITGGTKYLYLNWSTSWSIFILLLSIISWLYSGASFIWYTVLVLVLLGIACKKILSFAFSHWGIRLPGYLLINYSVLLCATFFFLSFDKGESWFWITCSVEYLLGFVILLLGISAVLSSSTTLFNYILIALFFTCVGGGVLPVVLVAYSSFFIYYAISLRKFGFKVKSSQNKFAKKVHVAFLFFFISALFMLLGPGKTARMATLPEPSFITAFGMFAKGVGKAAIHELPYALPVFFLCIIPWILLGHHFKKTGITLLRKIDLKKSLFRVIIGFAGLILVTLFPAAYLLSDIPPYRVWTQVYFGMAVLCCFGGLVFGNLTSIRHSFINALFISSGLVSLVLICVICYHQFKVVSVYSKAVDTRLERLEALEKKKNNKLIVLKKLPPSGLLYSAEVSTDSLHFNNDNLRKGLGLHFRVKLEY